MELVCFRQITGLHIRPASSRSPSPRCSRLLDLVRQLLFPLAAELCCVQATHFFGRNWVIEICQCSVEELYLKLASAEELQVISSTPQVSSAGFRCADYLAGYWADVLP